MKTTFLIVVALYTILEDPWNILHVMSTEDDAAEIAVERYMPIIRESPAFRELLDGSKHQMTRDAIRLNGCLLTFRGAYSPSGLASRPVAKLFLDEVDKWPEWSGKEADPIKLARERTRTFWNRKIISASTPTTAKRYIWPQLQAGSNEQYWVPCPHCQGYQTLVFGGRGEGPGIKWPDGIQAEEIQRSALAYYRCEFCSRAIQDIDKPEMLRHGEWRPQNPNQSRRHVSYHLWAGYSPWLTFSEIAAEFLRSKDQQSALMNFRNSWQAEPWEITVNELDNTVLRARVGTYHQGEIPREAHALVAGVDVQRTGSQVYQYYVLRAWGREGHSWLIRLGISEGWDQLYAVLFQSIYRDQDGKPIGLDVVLVDSGFEMDQVYQWCEMTGSWASKGDSKGRRPYTLTEAETSKGSGHFLRRVNFNPDFYKGQIHRLIRSEQWNLPMDLPREYFDQMTAEQMVSEVERSTGRPRYRWRLTVEGRANHYFDSEILCLVGADMLELRHRSARPRTVPEESQAQSFQPVATFKERIFS